MSCFFSSLLVDLPHHNNNIKYDITAHPGEGDTAGLFPGISGLLDIGLLGLTGVVGLTGVGLSSSSIVVDGASIRSLEGAI